jgi:hypothetical protein
MNLFDFPIIFGESYIGALNQINNVENMIINFDINVLYIAPSKYIEHLKKEISELKEKNPKLEVFPFNGGFKLNSIVLFSLSDDEDIKYFNKITGYSLGKNGELILNV